MSRETPIVSTNYGLVQGSRKTGANNIDFFSFQGIPYAKPPVGELRFKVIWKVGR